MKKGIMLPKYKKTDNSISPDKMVQRYRDLVAAPIVVSDVAVDDSLIKSLLAKGNGSDCVDEGLFIEDLVLPSEIRPVISSFLSEVEKAKMRYPLLVISGADGMGKRSISYAIANSLERKIVYSKDEVSKETILVVNHYDEFLSIEESLNDCPVIVTREFEKGFSIFGGDYDIEEDGFDGYLGPYHSLVLRNSAYFDPQVVEDLLESIIGQYNYIGKLPSNLEFRRSGIKAIPKEIKKHINRLAMQLENREEPFDKVALTKFFKTLSLKEERTSKFIEKRKPTKSLNDLIVKDTHIDMLQNIIHRINNNSSDYKFLDKLRPSKRVTSLFMGAPGTGKSMSGEVIAKETGRDCWILDFAKVQSCYVGETEKNLKNVFDEAQLADVVLIIDECDALFMSREKSNSEHTLKLVNYVLNLMESYSGILILTTNYGESLDSAMSRRIDFKLNFENPSEELMPKILKGFLLPDAPLQKGFCFESSCQGLNLSGGLLRNAVERAVIKMQMSGRKKISTEIMRESIKEMMEENKMILGSRRRLGL